MKPQGKFNAAFEENFALTNEDLPSCGPDNGTQMFGNIGHHDVSTCGIVILIVLITSRSCLEAPQYLSCDRGDKALTSLADSKLVSEPP